MQGVPRRERPRGAIRRKASRLRADLMSPIAQPLGAAVAAVLVLHALAAAGMVATTSSWMSFDLAVDRGLGELLSSLIAVTVIIHLLVLWRREPPDPLLVGLASLFALAVVTDLLMVHEQLTDRLVGFAAKTDDGWMAVGRASVVFVVAVPVLLGWSRRRSVASAPVREVADWLVGALAVLATFTVGVDLVQALLGKWTGRFDPLLAGVGDGGELIVLAAIASFVAGRVAAADADAVLDLDRLVIDDDGRIQLTSIPAMRESIELVPVDR